jgi:hypothetical protein
LAEIVGDTAIAEKAEPTLNPSLPTAAKKVPDVQQRSFIPFVASVGPLRS